MALSHADRQKLIAKALNIAPALIRDIFADVVIFQRDTDDAPRFFSRGVSIDASNVVTLGDETPVMRRTVWEEVATFEASVGVEHVSGAATFGDDLVMRQGPLFQLGDYPDKGLSFNAEEADAAITAFTPIANDMQHIPTLLTHDPKTGKAREDAPLGKTHQIWRVGNWLHGKVTVPAWLDKLVGPTEPIPTSLTIHRATKRIVGNALVLAPRITGAQIEAAFSAASGLHSNPGTPMSTNNQQNQPKWLVWLNGLRSAGQLPADAADFDPTKVTFSADAPAPTTPATPAATPTATATPTTPSPAEVQFAAQFAAQNEQIKNLQRISVQQAAIARFKTLTIEGRAIPAQQDAFVAMFCNAANADAAAASGIVTFSAEGSIVPGESMKQFEAFVSALPVNKLLREGIPAVSTFGLEGARPSGASGPMTADRKKELLGMGNITPGGRN